MAIEDTLQNIYGHDGYNVIPTLHELGLSMSEAEALVARARTQFDSIRAEALKGNLTPPEYLANKLCTAEEKLMERLEFGDQSSTSGLKETAYMLLEESFAKRPRGKFLKTTRIIDLLSVHPPRSLLEHFQFKYMEMLFEQYDPKHILAITRHTEDHEWQKGYQELLRHITADDFVERDIDFFAVDSDFIRPLFHANKHRIKPWRMSHNKEAGVITFFTMSEKEAIQTPHLLQTSVFLHYIYEIEYASRFFGQCAQNGENVGEKMSVLVANNRKSFPFLTDKNVFDETMYWDMAIDTISETIAPAELRAFKDLSAVGVFDGDRVLSANFVDILWNLNLSKTANSYFEHPTDHYKYHFKQSLWSDLIFRSYALPHERAQEVILANLEKTDQELMELLRNSAD